MRLYHFLAEKYALDDLKRKRLKLSRLADMNDPFELLGAALKTKRLRTAFSGYHADMDQRYGALCFCPTWTDPVVWSHYADRHRGMCFGFDVPKRMALPISYNAERLEIDIERQLAKDSRDTKLGLKLLTTKYSGWEYENEVRVVGRLNQSDPETGMYFCDFGPHLVLKEIVLGARSTLRRRDIVPLVPDGGVVIRKARLAFQKFSIVPQRNLKLWA